MNKSKDKILPAVRIETVRKNEPWRGTICPLPKEPKPKKDGKK